MRVWKAKEADLQLVLEFCREADELIAENTLKEYLSYSEDQPEGLYLMGVNNYPVMVCWVNQLRKAVRVSDIISTLEDDSADFSHYLQQFFAMFLYKFKFTDTRPLYCFTRSDYVLKVGLNAGLELYLETVDYRKRDFVIPEFQGLPVTIRPYQEIDIEQVLELERLIFMPEFWNDRQMIGEMVANPKGSFWVAELMGQVIGYNYNRILEDGTGHLVRVGVNPDYQLFGVGKTLLAHGISWFKEQQVSEIMLNVISENFKARTLYEKFGFEKEGFDYILRYAEGGN